MAEKIQELVKNLLDGVHSISHTDTIVGEATTIGDATVVPVHRLRIGFVAAGVDAGGQATAGAGTTETRGVGGGAQIDPVAVLAVGPDGRPRLLAVDGDAEGTWQNLLRDAPDLLAKFAKKMAERMANAVVTAVPDGSIPALPATGTKSDLPPRSE